MSDSSTSKPSWGMAEDTPRRPGRGSDRGAAARIAAIYLFFGVLWILFSDYLLLLITATPEQFARLQTMKGSFYVVITAVLVWSLVNRFAEQQQRIQNDLHNRGERLERNLREREVMIQEIHHRVKNNLQIVLSIIRLSSGSITDEDAVDRVQRISRRIRTIALVHENIMAGGNLDTLRCDQYFSAVVRNTTDIQHDPRIQIHLDISESTIPLDAAVPGGIILHELVENSLRHAFPGDSAERPKRAKNQEKRVEIAVRQGNGHQEMETLDLTVRDNGNGMPDRDPGRESLGLVIADAMARQLSATLSVGPRRDGLPGTEATVSFTPVPRRS